MAKFFRHSKLTVEKKDKYATICRDKKGRKVVLLTPSGKVKRYGRELNSGINSETKKPLTAKEIGYRKGYRSALGEQAKIFNKKHGFDDGWC